MSSRVLYSRYRGEDYACIDGTVYGPCPSEACYGVCEPVGSCDEDEEEWQPIEELYGD